MKAHKYTPNPRVRMPRIESYGHALRLAESWMGPKAQVWRGGPGEPKWMAGQSWGDRGCLILGFGDNLKKALEDAISAHQG